MPTATKKPLHLGNSIGDLNTKANAIPKVTNVRLLVGYIYIHLSVVYSNNIHYIYLYFKFCCCFSYIFRFINSAGKVFKSAEERNVLGDEEMAYVFFMKYFNLISAIKKCAEFKKHEVSYDTIIIFNIHIC